ncbi:unnamed protein product [Cladocopium goreaui]|nr:unnamed protein product [Cladocopium goreaui]
MWGQLCEMSSARNVKLDLSDRARAAQGLVAALLDRLLEDAQGMPGLRRSLDAVLKDPKIRTTLSKDLNVPLPPVEGKPEGVGRECWTT